MRVEPQPRVAVIVPCYNDGETLSETLASLANEEQHELVVVDDGSTAPATLAVLDEIANSGVRVIRQKNQGLAAARMAGVAATSAPYVQPLDADDLIEPGAITALANALDAHPEAAVAWGDIAVFGPFDSVVRAADGLDPWLIWFLDELPSASMVRRSLLEVTGGWQFNGPYEDWDLWMAAAEHRLIGIRVPRVMLRYRWDPDRMSAGGLARHGELLAELRRRHPQLQAALATNRRQSSASTQMRLLFPLIDLLPGMSGLNKHRLRRLVAHPRRTLAYRRMRQAANSIPR